MASRHFREWIPSFLGKYPGDALWALMVYFGWGVIFPKASIARIAAGAMGFSVGIEFLKLWQAPWLVNFRETMPGHLIFGQVFSWGNLVAYAVGVSMGMGIELAGMARRDEKTEGERI